MATDGIIRSTDLNGGAYTFLRDEDGEFLAIEVAEHLPGWMDEGNAEGRVLIHRGKLHLISPTVVPWSPDDSPLAPDRAIAAVSSGLSGTGPSTLAPRAC